MSRKRQTKPTQFEHHIQELLRGWQAEPPPLGKQVTIGGRVTTTTQVLARLEELLAAGATVRDQQQALQKSIAQRDGLYGEGREFYADLVMVLRQQYGRDAQALARFGINLPRARGPLSTEARAIAKARRAAKRARQQAQAEPGPRVVVLGADGQPLGQQAANDAPGSAAPPATGTLPR